MLNELFILSKIKEGDIKAFEEVFHRYYSPLCWYAAGIIGQMEVAEEIVEELFNSFGTGLAPKCPERTIPANQG